LAVARHATPTAATGTWPMFGSRICCGCHKILWLIPLLIFITPVAALFSA